MTSANRTRIYQQMFKHPPYLFQVQFSHDKTNTPTTLDTLSPPIFFFSDLPIDRLERTTPTMASVATEVLTNHASAVGKYFGSVRVPASFIAGASFAGLFTVQIKEDGHGSSASRSLLSKYLSRAYHVCILIAFLLAINTVVVSTAANTMSLHDGSFNPMATSGYMVLKNEYCGFPTSSELVRPQSQTGNPSCRPPAGADKSQHWVHKDNASFGGMWAYT